MVSRSSLHVLWHLPTFFTFIHGPFILSSYVGFFLVAVAGTFLYTWVFNHTKESVLLATLTHGFSGAAGFVFLLVPAHLVLTWWARPFVSGGWNADGIVIFGTCALLLLVATRGRLGFNPERNAQLFEVPGPAERPQTSI